MKVTLNSLDDPEDVFDEGVFHRCRALPFLILGKFNRYIRLLLRRSLLQYAQLRLSRLDYERTKVNTGKTHLLSLSFLPLSFITEPRITAGIEVSRAQGDAAAGCHGSGAP